MIFGRYQITEWDGEHSLVDVSWDEDEVVMKYCDSGEQHCVDIKYFKLLSPVKTKDC